MFLAAGPYFQKRFAGNKKILENFQSTELSVSTVANLGAMIVLTKMQAKASYPKRIIASLSINSVIFALLAISTRHFLNTTAGGYFAFLIIMVLGTSIAVSLCQNGLFAYVGALGREEYTQGIMVGQAVAGVLPCIVQIISVLSVPAQKVDSGEIPHQSSKSAFAYFLTATLISICTLMAFFLLLSRHGVSHNHKGSIANASTDPDPLASSMASLDGSRNTVPFTTLFRKLFWLATAIFLDFAVSMVFPVFTQEIQSVRPIESAPRLFQPSSFIPLAFLFWNSGDLMGRLVTAIPSLTLGRRPKLLVILAVLRISFVPLYLLCNIKGHGAAVQSDVFYLFIVQLGFGITNGYIGSCCMMSFVEFVDVEEREAAGGFMGLCLVAGLTVGSLASFLVARNA
jgi:solute carrier family 29 (equilibrative nucleoside transporter), member 1/2/3